METTAKTITLPSIGTFTLPLVPNGVVRSSDGSVSANGSEAVAIFTILTLKSALKLEVIGMRHSRGSVYAQTKRVFGFQGTKRRVLEQLEQWIRDNIQPVTQH